MFDAALAGPALTPTAASSGLSAREALLCDVAVALHESGSPAHRLETALDGLSERLGLEAVVSAAPTALLLRLPSGTRLLRVRPGGLDLGHLVEVERVVAELGDGTLDVAEAQAALRTASEGERGYAPWVTWLAFGLSSAVVVPFFNGSMGTAAVALVLGLGVGALCVGAEYSARIGRLLPLLAGLWCGLGAHTLATLPFLGGLAPDVAIVAGLIVLVPGLSLTTAMSELVAGHLSSGTARLMGALVTVLQLGLGVALGRSMGLGLAEFADLVLPLTEGSPLPGWTHTPALVLAAMSFLVLFRARAEDLMVLIAVGFLAVEGTELGVSLVGPALGPGLGALYVTLGSNLQARLRGVPAGVALVPGLILLVPGSLSFRSIDALASQQTLAGVDAAMTTLMVATALVAGILAGNALLPSRRAL